ncbi:hypothetical protein HY310_01240 [Candidatus Microgenomates bacterium]|nr:hypothetical protein [Candidatus Microgenomates bacterium]
MNTVPFIATIISILGNVGLGILVYAKNPKSTTNRLLSALTIILSLWAVSNYLSLNSIGAENTLFWIRIVMVVTAPLGPILYLFITTFPEQNFNSSKKVLVFLLISIFVVAFLSFTPFVFSSVDVTKGVHPTPGFGIILYGLLILGSLAAAFIKLVKKYKNSTGLIRAQLRYLVLGILLTFSLQAVTNFVFVVLLNYSDFVALGPLFSLILVSCVTYATIRHHFLDVGFVPS